MSVLTIGLWTESPFTYNEKKQELDLPGQQHLPTRRLSDFPLPDLLFWRAEATPRHRCLPPPTFVPHTTWCVLGTGRPERSVLEEKDWRLPGGCPGFSQSKATPVALLFRLLSRVVTFPQRWRSDSATSLTSVSTWALSRLCQENELPAFAMQVVAWFALALAAVTGAWALTLAWYLCGPCFWCGGYIYSCSI